MTEHTRDKKTSENNSFYITTTLPYVNAEPHIGFAMEIIRADIVARIKKKQGYDVFFNTGTDEHGAKIFENAQAKKQDTQAYVDHFAASFKKLIAELNIDPEVHFIRTTDPAHKAAAQEFWRRSYAAGDIYKKNYKIKYCVGCELEKTESDLENGRCPLHPNKEIQEIEEENYFFAFSKYQTYLLDLYVKNPQFVVPDFRFNEIKEFVKRGLQDFSISRIKAKMPWGVPVPNDDDHVMYVWFDALVNYISAIGWPHDMEKFNRYWPVFQYAGKDNLRQQSAMWQAMLMSVGLPASKQIVIEGFITGDGGIKMSKSLGNTVSPFDYVEKYGPDALRFFFVNDIHPYEDSPFTEAIFIHSYNAHLANGIGNTASRILKMAEMYHAWPETYNTPSLWSSIPDKQFADHDIKSPLTQILTGFNDLNQSIQKDEPFKLWKIDQEKTRQIVTTYCATLYALAHDLSVYIPQTSQAIIQALEDNKSLAAGLFPRK